MAGKMFMDKQKDNQSALSWTAQAAALRLIAAERLEIEKIVSPLYGYHLITLGEPVLGALVDSSLISHQVIINPEIEADRGKLRAIRGRIEALAVKNESVDVVVLTHSLEQTENPHEVLREAHRVLIPEGYLVITGLRPMSLWGAWYYYKRLRRQISPQGQLLGANRIKDWLQLLNFQVIGGGPFFYRPPFQSERLFNKLAWLEKWGEKGGPLLAGAYSLVAVKRMIPLTVQRVNWKTPPPVWPQVDGLAKPTANNK